MPYSSDPFLDSQLATLENLIAERPDSPEARFARRLARRVRYYRAGTLLQNAPRTRRYVLADIRTTTQKLKTTAEPRGRDPPP